mgnify:CR=1 FL=1
MAGMDARRPPSDIDTPAWVRDAVFYQIYPQSFCDSNGDGIGDIPGIIQKLDYLSELGVNAVWLNPCFTSPFQDAGYDVADYCKVAPRYGTNADLVRLFGKARRRGIRFGLAVAFAQVGAQFFLVVVRDRLLTTTGLDSGLVELVGAGQACKRWSYYSLACSGWLCFSPCPSLSSLSTAS